MCAPRTATRPRAPERSRRALAREGGLPQAPQASHPLLRDEPGNRERAGRDGHQEVRQAARHHGVRVRHLADAAGTAPQRRDVVARAIRRRSREGARPGRSRAKPVPATFYPNGIEHPEDMEPILGPLLDLSEYPHGWTIMHEECLTLAHKYDVPCRFIYSVNRRTRDFVEKLYRAEGALEESDLELMNNVNRPLVGTRPRRSPPRVRRPRRLLLQPEAQRQSQGVERDDLPGLRRRPRRAVHVAPRPPRAGREVHRGSRRRVLPDLRHRQPDDRGAGLRARRRTGGCSLESSDPHMDWGEREFIRM